MPKPSLGDIISSVPDPMLSDNFSLEIPNIPTGASSTPLYMQCRTAAKPGITINAVEVQLFGHTTEHAGNLTYSHDMSVEYLDNRKAQIMTLIEDWCELCRSHETQHGSYKNEYARDAYLKIYDQKGLTVVTYQIVGLWPNTMPETQFDGQASNVIAHQIGFKYDYYKRK